MVTIILCPTHSHFHYQFPSQYLNHAPVVGRAMPSSVSGAKLYVLSHTHSHTETHSWAVATGLKSGKHSNKKTAKPPRQTQTAPCLRFSKATPTSCARNSARRNAAAHVNARTSQSSDESTAGGWLALISTPCPRGRGGRDSPWGVSLHKGVVSLHHHGRGVPRARATSFGGPCFCVL